MTSIYFDHKAILGADEKPILNPRHRRHVASVAIERTFNQESQMSAAPSRRKNRFSSDSVGIDSTTGKPTENYSFKEPLSYQNVKYEDDNVRFLATGRRIRPNDVNNRRYQKFQTATQRISSLNVYPDGTSRQGPSSIPQLEQMIELMQNPPIQSTLGKTGPGGIRRLDYAFFTDLLDEEGNPIPVDPESRRSSVSSAADVGFAEEKSVYIGPPLVVFDDEKIDPGVKEALIEAQFKVLQEFKNEGDILFRINNSKEFLNSIIKKGIINGKSIPPELSTIYEKINIFNKNEFKEDFKYLKTEPEKMSQTNIEALWAMSTMSASGYFKGNDDTNFTYPTKSVANVSFSSPILPIIAKNIESNIDDILSKLKDSGNSKLTSEDYKMLSDNYSFREDYVNKIIGRGQSDVDEFLIKEIKGIQLMKRSTPITPPSALEIELSNSPILSPVSSNTSSPQKKVLDLVSKIGEEDAKTSKTPEDPAAPLRITENGFNALIEKLEKKTGLVNKDYTKIVFLTRKTRPVIDKTLLTPDGNKDLAEELKQVKKNITFAPEKAKSTKKITQPPLISSNSFEGNEYKQLDEDIGNARPGTNDIQNVAERISVVLDDISYENIIILFDSEKGIKALRTQLENASNDKKINYDDLYEVIDSPSSVSTTSSIANLNNFYHVNSIPEQKITSYKSSDNQNYIQKAQQLFLDKDFLNGLSGLKKSDAQQRDYAFNKIYSTFGPPSKGSKSAESFNRIQHVKSYFNAYGEFPNQDYLTDLSGKSSDQIIDLSRNLTRLTALNSIPKIVDRIINSSSV